MEQGGVSQINFNTIIEWDKQYSANKEKRELYATATHTSFYNVLEEACKIIPNNTCFIDLGSGLGHVLFYMRAKYPWVKCMGIEKEKDLYQESIRRKNYFEILDSEIEIVNKDVFKVFGTDFSEHDYYIMYSFDVLYPMSLIDHIHESIVKQCKKPVIWITNTHVQDAMLLKSICITGAPGWNENDKHVTFTIWGGGEEDDSNIMVKIKDYVDQQEMDNYTNFMKHKNKPIKRDKDGDIIMKLWEVYGMLPECRIPKMKEMTKYPVYLIKN
jgi:SAM-dependent methyltransferase